MIDMILAILRYLLATIVFLSAGFIFAVGCVRIWFPQEWLKEGDIYFGHNEKLKQETGKEK
jgi:hypothetical protein